MAKKAKHPIQELREALELNHQALGDAIGRSRAFISLAESGSVALGRETVLLLVDRYREDLNQLGITAEDLLRGSRRRAKHGAAA